MVVIDFRAVDARERGLPDQRDRPLEFHVDLALAQRIQKGLDKHCEDAAVDAAEKRMRGGRQRG